MTRDFLLSQLPPYQDQWVLIHPDQTVKDIISEVLEAHNEFAPYYDKIGLCFDGGSVENICDRLYYFLLNNIKYKEETEDSQTSALPSGILTRGIGDCKHYSGFSAGILDALNRSGKKINWCYRFASYKALDQTPHHVFIVVKQPGGEIWIDPTPNAKNSEPIWFTDKKIKADMAIHRNIAGLEFNEQSGTMQVVGRRPYWQLMPLEGARTQPNAQTAGANNKYFSTPFLGLQFYSEDPLSVEGTDWNLTADAINQAIATGVNPGHTVDGSFVKWVYDANIKGWNFYYPGGVVPGYVPNNLPAGYPRLIITADGRLTLDSTAKLDDYKNDEIHALTAWAQDLINKNDPTPYPVKPSHIKEFSQGKQGDPDKRNLFTEARGNSIFKEIALFVKDGFLTIVGSIPRNAFLAMVGLNAFNFAKNFQNKIDQGLWNEIAHKWESLGGNPEKLWNTIQDGQHKEAQYDDRATIGELTSLAAIMSAAAPIIAVMIKFLDKDGKVSEVLAATKGFVEANFPNVDLTAFGFLDKTTGQELPIKIADQDNELLGGGDDRMPPPNTFRGSDPYLDWIKQNPVIAIGIGFALWELFAPKKMRIINK